MKTSGAGSGGLNPRHSAPLMDPFQRCLRVLRIFLLPSRRRRRVNAVAALVTAKLQKGLLK